MTTGQKCDTIYKVNQRVAHLHGMTLTHRNRAIDGDSGGPWWWGNIAYGVHSGRTPHNILWLLLVTNAVLQLIDWNLRVGGNANGPSIRRYTKALENLLVDGGSAYMVDEPSERLLRRIDPTTHQAVEQIINTAPSTAADHLRHAWHEAYGVEPDPDKSYSEAIKAVEDVACQLICPNADNKRTLGTAIAYLRNDLTANHPKWQLALPDKDGSPASIKGLTEIMDLLWSGQTSRHAGSSKSRRQTQAEAELAVHLAATLVHWLANGAALQARP
jgi:hypothetical protein